MESQMPGEFASIFVLIMMVVAIFVVLIVTIITLVAYCKITAKAGYHWALGILMIVPFGNIILPLYLAFADWPVHKELRQLKQRSGGTPA
jgi:heme/copper-type cytochrome/quinol oxidase subunit 2